MRHSTPIRHRNSIDSTLPPCFNSTTNNSPRRQLKLQIPSKNYYIPKIRQPVSFHYNTNTITNQNQALKSVEYTQESYSQDKTLQFQKVEGRQKSEDKILVYDVFKENKEVKVSEFLQDKQIKRYSLPSLKKKSVGEIQQHIQNQQPSDTSNMKTLLDDQFEETKKREMPQTTERILDLLMLNTCELKKVFQKCNPTRTRRKIIVQKRIPQDFFSVLKQF